jgi:hypothetical protein
MLEKLLALMLPLALAIGAWIAVALPWVPVSGGG